MQVVIPALFQTNPLLDMMGEPRLPALDILLARGHIENTTPASLDGWLCRELGIPQHPDTPIAAICLAVDGINPEQDHWLRADPVHVRIARDQLILAEIPSLTSDEAAQLCDALKQHFGEDFAPVITRTGAWVVKANHHAAFSTTALSSAIGKHIDPLLPKGADAMHWRKLLNEVQMLLYTHPVNQAREAQGLPVANSVWLWGSGRLPTMPEAATKTPATPAIMTGHPLAQTLAQFAGAALPPMQPAWTADLETDLLILDAPHAALQRGDFSAWLENIKTLEQNWLQPLLTNKKNFHLHDPTEGKRLIWKNTDRWKFWRRPQTPKCQTFEFETPASNANATGNMDEFGNRF